MALLGGHHGLDLTEFRAFPKLTAILEEVGCRLRDLSSAIALHDVQGEVNSRSQTAGGGNLAVLDEPGSTYKVNRWVLFLHLRCVHVMGRSSQAVTTPFDARWQCACERTIIRIEHEQFSTYHSRS
jgi:hypothetical protein